MTNYADFQVDAARRPWRSSFCQEKRMLACCARSLSFSPRVCYILLAVQWEDISVVLRVVLQAASEHRANSGQGQLQLSRFSVSDAFSRAFFSQVLQSSDTRSYFQVVLGPYNTKPFNPGYLNSFLRSSFDISKLLTQSRSRRRANTQSFQIKFVRD